MARIQIDFDEVETSLRLVIPTVYRKFIDEVNNRSLPLERSTFNHTTSMIIERTLELRETWGNECDTPFLATDSEESDGDGCGNVFAIRASMDSADTDEWILLAHDPFGVEHIGTATAMFQFYLENASDEWPNGTPPIPES